MTLPSALISPSFTPVPVSSMPRSGFILVFARWGAKTKLAVQRIMVIARQSKNQLHRVPVILIRRRVDSSGYRIRSGWSPFRLANSQARS